LGAICFAKNYSEETVQEIVEIQGVFVSARNDFQKGKGRYKMLVNIGMNRREAQLMARALKLGGYTVAEVLCRSARRNGRRSN
jgi:hypothetical protein